MSPRRDHSEAALTRRSGARRLCPLPSAPVLLVLQGQQEGLRPEMWHKGTDPGSCLEEAGLGRGCPEAQGCGGRLTSAGRGRSRFSRRGAGARDSACLTSASTSPPPPPLPTASMQAAGGLCVFLKNNNNNKWGLRSSCAHALGISCTCIASVCPQTISRAAVLGEAWGWGWALGYKVDETRRCPRAAHVRHEVCKSPTARRCRDGNGN